MGSLARDCFATDPVALATAAAGASAWTPARRRSAVRDGHLAGQTSRVAGEVGVLRRSCRTRGYRLHPDHIRLAIRACAALPGHEIPASRFHEAQLTGSRDRLAAGGGTQLAVDRLHPRLDG